MTLVRTLALRSLSTFLALVGVLAASTALAASGKTLWLTEPLYPGQDLLVGRTESAISEIIPKEQRAAELIGQKELEQFLSGKKVDLGCITGESACKDPIDAMVAGLDLDRVVLIRGGQDESGYRYKVTSYRPATGEVASAEGSNAKLERALLGALVKVVPLASTMELTSAPSGATVFIDGEKVGQTPLSLQVLPGERAIKLELGSHLPVEFTENVPVRGSVKVERTLEKVPARIVVVALPEGTSIAIDGKEVGKNKVDQGINPGQHTVSLSREGYLPHEESLSIAPGDTANVERTLAPTTWTGVKATMHDAQEDIYGRHAYLVVNFESARFTSVGFRTHIGDNPQEVQGIPRPAVLSGVTAEYGNTGRNFGLAVIGATYLSGSDVPVVPNDTGIAEPADLQSLTLRALQPQLRWAIWRVTLGAQLGLDVRLVQFLWRGDNDIFGAANRAVDLDLAAQANLRVYVWEGMFLNGSYRWSHPLLSGNAGMSAFQGGLGYAF